MCTHVWFEHVPSGCDGKGSDLGWWVCAQASGVEIRERPVYIEEKKPMGRGTSDTCSAAG